MLDVIVVRGVSGTVRSIIELNKNESPESDAAGLPFVDTQRRGSLEKSHKIQSLTMTPIYWMTNHFFHSLSLLSVQYFSI